MMGILTQCQRPSVCLSPADSKSRGGDIEFSVNLFIRFLFCFFVCVCLCCLPSGTLVYFSASICVSLVFSCKFVHIAIMLLYT